MSLLQDEIIRALFGYATERVYPVENPSTSEHMALAAVGGYGRETLAPGSDIDLLMHPSLQADGLDGAGGRICALHAVGHGLQGRPRDPQCRRVHSPVKQRYDHPHRHPRCALSSAAPKASYDEMEKRFDAEVVRNSARAFIAAKLAERDVRHQKAGDTRYLVEPNVKEGKGGLSDLQTLFWLAKYYYRVRALKDLVKLRCPVAARGEAV